MLGLLIATFAFRWLQMELTERGEALFWILEVARWGAILAIFVVAKGVWMDLARRLDQVIETVYAAKR